MNETKTPDNKPDIKIHKYNSIEDFNNYSFKIE